MTHRFIPFNISLLVAMVLAKDGPATAIQQKNDASLGIYLSKHPWDATKRGAMLVVDPESTPPMSFAGGLAAYGRKEFNLGSLTAVAPLEMVYIDASFNEPANFYDGLPRSDKIVYLMSLLDGDQWTKACSTGIGFADMRPDQRAVYRSILPSVFTYDNAIVGKGNRILQNPNEPPVITLTAEEEAGVRLHFFQELELGVKMQSGGFSAVGSSLSDLKREGRPFLHRSDVAAEDRKSMFGIQIRKVLDNHLKPSDLDYKSHTLDSSLSLPKQTTVGEMCKSASSACGLKLVADIRIAGLPVEAFGDAVRTGDVLEALALSVTGTFRKVGDCYLLTCDLEGIGAKRQKLDTLRQDLALQARQRVREWKRSIGANGGARKIAFRTDSPLPMNDAIKSFLAEDHDNNGQVTMLAGQLPSEWQAILNTGVSRFAPGQMRTDVAFPYGEVMWNFVLPDGTSLEWEESLGYANALTRQPGPERDRSSKSVVSPIALRSGSSSALVFKTDDPIVGAKLPGLAQTHGFEEVWIQTWQPACLKAALEAAKTQDVRIRLVLRPWEIPKGVKSTDPDRTILGDTSSEAESRTENTALWIDSSPVWGVPPAIVGTFIGPNDPLRDSLWTKLIDLSKTAGLDGVVLCDTEPRGYEPGIGDPFFWTSLLDLGYSQSLRNRFVKENQVDPIDIVNRRLMMNEKLDLSLPFFGDPRQAAEDQPAGSLAKWAKLHAETNRESISALMSQLAAPVLFQPRLTTQETMTLSGVQVVPWRNGSELPTGVFRQNLEEEAQSAPADGYCVWSYGHPDDPAVSSRMYDSLLRLIKHTKGKLAIDLSSVPLDEVPKVLDRWFKKG